MQCHNSADVKSGGFKYFSYPFLAQIPRMHSPYVASSSFSFDFAGLRRLRPRRYLSRYGSNTVRSVQNHGIMKVTVVLSQLARIVQIPSLDQSPSYRNST